MQIDTTPTYHLKLSEGELETVLRVLDARITNSKVKQTEKDEVMPLANIIRHELGEPLHPLTEGYEE